MIKIIFIANLSSIYEDEWISSDGMIVKLKDNVADVTVYGVEYYGSYKTQFIHTQKTNNM